MNITHHPGDEALAAFAGGTLDEGRSLVLATHLSFCSACRTAARTFEHVGGAFLDGIEPAGLGADALQRALARTAVVDTLIQTAPSAQTSGASPVPLSLYALSPWRWLGRGLRWRRVDVSTERGSRVLLLDAAPGTRLHRHRHAGTEWTCVLEGAFWDDLGRYGPGDFDESDDTVEHAPAAEEGSHPSY